MNGYVYLFCRILKFVVTYAVESELEDLFLNAKEGKFLQILLQELGHNRPPMPIRCDNVTASGIANYDIKKQRSFSMEIIFF